MIQQDGVLVLHKPAGMTSHDCVAQVRRLFHTKKAGHTGTLDPEVTGVLPVCLGQATRIVEYLQELPKAYEVVMRLGYSTTTEDASGELLQQKQVDTEITEEQVKAAMQQFLGEIEQIPPMYSAVKVNGQRLYDLAREGKVIERQPRTVTIYRLALHSIETHEGVVDVSFACECSKGTYMRTLCVDLGEKLGYPAHMLRLVRVKSGPFSLDQAIPLHKLQELAGQEEQLAELLVPLGDALSFLPRCDIAPERKKAVQSGLETALPDTQLPEGSLVRLYCEQELLGLHRVHYGQRGPFGKAEKIFQPNSKA
ncbi:tRNA pseudouridine(55) synthase TruB [Brevibacillus fulvus]|uniref:tRNA pseudouridine synthase B n=1 Tax=Brevibacillus fulvus TaxID=1125967 RepID=A0A938XZE9_9BACL|nr:tRNA pseudouridine(55) synthase TruB [Brevibacillus fulvus]MBM7590576.1 tRNA pseudouridine55 synthase [Brevibacillus fulvus]